LERDLLRLGRHRLQAISRNRAVETRIGAEGLSQTSRNRVGRRGGGDVGRCGLFDPLPDGSTEA
jgi:hypothetical protein